MGMLWMGPRFGKGDGSRRWYRGGCSRSAPARELPVFTDYRQCQYQITRWGESADARLPVCCGSRCVFSLARGFELKTGATHLSSRRV